VLATNTLTLRIKQSDSANPEKEKPFVKLTKLTMSYSSNNNRFMGHIRLTIFSLLTVCWHLVQLGPISLLAQDGVLNITPETVQLALDTQPNDEVLVVLVSEGSEQVFFSGLADSTVTIISGVPAPSEEQHYEVRVNGERVNAIERSDTIILDWPSEEGDSFEVLASRDGEFWMSRYLVVADGDSVSLSLESSGDEAEFFVVRSGIAPTPPANAGAVEGWLTLRGESLVMASPDRRIEGDKPAAGASVQLNGLIVETDATGRFAFAGLEPEQVHVSATLDELSWQQEILILPNQALSIGTETMGRMDAYEAFLKQAEAEGWIGDDGRAPYPLKTTRVVGTTHTIPASTPVTSIDILGRQSTFNHLKLDEPAWMFHLDPYGNQAYGHDALIGLVGDVSGEVVIKRFPYWPVINEVSYWVSLEQQVQQGLLRDLEELPDLFKLGSQLPLTEQPVADSDERNAFRPLDHPTPPCPSGRVFAVFIQGGTERTFGVSAEKFRAHIKPDVSKIIRPDIDILGPNSKGSVNAVYSRIVSRFYAFMQPCDTLVVYLAGHGSMTDDGKAGGGVNFINGNFSGMSASDILRPLRNLPACHLLVVIDSCFSGSMINTQPANNFARIADGFLPDHVQALFVSSADDKTGALFRKVYELFGKEFPSNGGGLFTLELIAAGLGNKRPLSLNAFNAGVAGLKATSGTAAANQGATTFLLNAKLPCQPPPIDQDGSTETEPNDDEETADEMGSGQENEAEKTASGSLGLDGEDTDVWKSEFEAGDYRFEDIGGDYAVEIKTGDQVIQGSTPAFEFEIPKTGEVQIQISGGLSELYQFTIRPIQTQSEIWLRNETESWVAFEITGQGEESISSEAILLQPGETFERKMETTYESVKLIHLHNSKTEGDGGIDQETGVTLGKGERGIFLIQETGIQTWQEPIDAALLSGQP
jgi:hypothetical protein